MTSIAPAHLVPDAPSFKRCIARLEAEAPESIGGALREECRQQYQALEQRALGALIASRWLIQQARALGLAVPGGSLTRRAAAAEAKLRRMLAAGEVKITQARIAAYYEQNIERYERPEQREIEIAEHIPTRREAQTLFDRAKRRGAISGMAIRPPALLLPETIPNSNPADVPPPRRAAVRAIFAVKPHTLVGPVPLNEQWCLFEVTDVTPRAVKPLAEVRAAIEQWLAREQRQRTLTSYITAWRKRWTARTDCSRGYVVQKCRQYHGPRTLEDPLAFD